MPETLTEDQTRAAIAWLAGQLKEHGALPCDVCPVETDLLESCPATAPTCAFSWEAAAQKATFPHVARLQGEKLQTPEGKEQLLHDWLHEQLEWMAEQAEFVLDNPCQFCPEKSALYFDQGENCEYCAYQDAENQCAIGWIDAARQAALTGQA